MIAPKPISDTGLSPEQEQALALARARRRRAEAEAAKPAPVTSQAPPAPVAKPAPAVPASGMGAMGSRAPVDAAAFAATVPQIKPQTTNPQAPGYFDPLAPKTPNNQNPASPDFQFNWQRDYPQAEPTPEVELPAVPEGWTDSEWYTDRAAGMERRNQEALKATSNPVVDLIRAGDKALMDAGGRLAYKLDPKGQVPQFISENVTPAAQKLAGGLGSKLPYGEVMAPLAEGIGGGLSEFAATTARNPVQGATEATDLFEPTHMIARGTNNLTEAGRQALAGDMAGARQSYMQATPDLLFGTMGVLPAGSAIVNGVAREVAAPRAALQAQATRVLNAADEVAPPTGRQAQPQPSVSPVAQPDLPNGFFRSADEGDQHRAYFNVNTGVAIQKNYASGGVDSFYVTKDGTIGDVATINHADQSSKANIWQPNNANAKQEAIDLLNERGKHAFGSPQRKALDARLKQIVADDQAGTYSAATTSQAPKASPGAVAQPTVPQGPAGAAQGATQPPPVQPPPAAPIGMAVPPPATATQAASSADVQLPTLTRAEKRAADILIKRLEADGVSWDDVKRVAASMGRRGDSGVYETIGELVAYVDGSSGANMRGLQMAGGTIPGATQERIVGRVAENDKLLPKRVTRAGTRATGQMAENAVDTLQALNQRLRTESGPRYETFYSAPVDPRVFANEVLPIIDTEAGQIAARQALTAIRGKEARLRARVAGGKASAGQTRELEHAAEAARSLGAYLREGELRALVASGKASPDDIAELGQLSGPQIPSPYALNRIKRAFDNQIEAAGQGSEIAKDIRGTKTDFADGVSNATGGKYGEALGFYEGSNRLEEAFQFGNSALSKKSWQLKLEMEQGLKGRAWSGGEIEAIAMGVARQIEDLIEANDQRALTMLIKGKALENLATALGDPKAAARFEQSMRRLAANREWGRRVAKGSDTAMRQASVAEMATEADDAVLRNLDRMDKTQTPPTPFGLGWDLLVSPIIRGAKDSYQRFRYAGLHDPEVNKILAPILGDAATPETLKAADRIISARLAEKAQKQGPVAIGYGSPPKPKPAAPSAKPAPKPKRSPPGNKLKAPGKPPAKTGGKKPPPGTTSMASPAVTGALVGGGIGAAANPDDPGRGALYGAMAGGAVAGLGNRLSKMGGSKPGVAASAPARIKRIEDMVAVGDKGVVDVARSMPKADVLEAASRIASQGVNGGVRITNLDEAIQIIDDAAEFRSFANDITRSDQGLAPYPELRTPMKSGAGEVVPFSKPKPAPGAGGKPQPVGAKAAPPPFKPIEGAERIDTTSWTPTEFNAARKQLNEMMQDRRTMSGQQLAELDREITSLRNALDPPIAPEFADVPMASRFNAPVDQPWPKGSPADTAIKKAIEGKNWTVQSVPLAKVIPTQDSVFFDYAKAAGRYAGDDRLPIVVKQGDQYFVADGHHRLMAQGGADQVRARVIDLAPPSKGPGGKPPTVQAGIGGKSQLPMDEASRMQRRKAWQAEKGPVEDKTWWHAGAMKDELDPTKGELGLHIGERSAAKKVAVEARDQRMIGARSDGPTYQLHEPQELVTRGVFAQAPDLKNFSDPGEYLIRRKLSQEWDGRYEAMWKQLDRAALAARRADPEKSNALWRDAVHKAARDHNISGWEYQNYFEGGTSRVVFGKDAARSVNAAFDPSQEGSSKLLSAFPGGTAAQAASGAGGAAYGYANPVDANEDGVIDDQDRAITATTLGLGGLTAAGLARNALSRGPRGVKPPPASNAFGGGKGKPPPAAKPKSAVGGIAGRAAVGSAIGAGVGSIAEGQTGDAQAQMAEVAAQMAKLQKTIDGLQAVLDIYDTGTPEQIQAAVARGGKYTKPDGVIGRETSAQVAADRARIAVEMKAALAELDKGRARVKQLEEQAAFDKTRPGMALQAARQAAPWIGALGGALGGAKMRGGAVSKAAAEAVRREASVNALLTPGPIKTGRDAATRAAVKGQPANINEYWIRGGAGDKVPFEANAKGDWRMRPKGKVMPASKLFPDGKPGLRKNDLAWIATGLSEAGLSTLGVDAAHKELAAAQAAVENDKTEANYERLERAHDMLALAETMQRAGLGFAAGRLIGAYKTPYKSARPNVQNAEAEMARIAEYLQRLKK